MRRITLFLMLFLVACSAGDEAPIPTAPTEPTTPPPEPAPQPEPIVLEPEEPEPTPDEPEYYEIPDSALSSVSCDGDALTFTITNTVDKTWSLNTLSFPPPIDKDQLQIHINGREPWMPEEYFSLKSLKDCTDALIEPGDSFSCTVEPVPLIPTNPYSRNTIQVKAPRINEQAHFTC